MQLLCRSVWRSALRQARDRIGEHMQSIQKTMLRHEPWAHPLEKKGAPASDKKPARQVTEPMNLPGQI